MSISDSYEQGVSVSRISVSKHPPCSNTAPVSNLRESGGLHYSSPAAYRELPEGSRRYEVAARTMDHLRVDTTYTSTSYTANPSNSSNSSTPKNNPSQVYRSMRNASSAFMAVIEFTAKNEISLEGQKLLDFALNLLERRSALVVLAVDIRKEKSSNDRYSARIENMLTDRLKPWLGIAASKEVEILVKSPIGSSWKASVRKEVEKFKPSVLLLGPSHMSTTISNSVMKKADKFVEVLPNFCNLYIVRNGNCIYEKTGLSSPNADPSPNNGSLVQSFSSFSGSSSSSEQPPYRMPSQGFNPPQPSPINLHNLSEAEYTLQEVYEATEGFAKHNVIGEGGCAVVYRATSLRGADVAVKRLKKPRRMGKTGRMDGSVDMEELKSVLEQFLVEVRVIRSLSHRNLLSLRGYCCEGVEIMAVFDFMRGGSLESRLRDPDLPPLTWHERLRIAKGSAEALKYLHFDGREPLMHRDVKSANILLDDNLKPYVADFGLAKFVPEASGSSSISTTQIFGTNGYLDPEYHFTGVASQKSDVYSFGVVLWEILTGLRVVDESRIPPFLGPWAIDQIDESGKCDSIMDPRLNGAYDQKQAMYMAMIASLCVREKGKDRPDMDEVVTNLVRIIGRSNMQ